MSIFSDLLTGGIGPVVSSVAGSVSEVVKRFVPDPDKALEAQRAVQEAVANSMTAQMQAMQSVMTADSQSTSVYTSGARPTVVYWSLLMITVIVAMGAFGHADPALKALSQVPEKLWEMITYGIGIFAAGRTAEKMTDAVTGAIVKRR
jgi:hypothetical protein